MSYVTRMLVQASKYALLLLALIAVVVPISLIFTGSFKGKHEFFLTGPLDPPENWLNFDNYIRAFHQGGMIVGFANTIFYLFFGLSLSILIGAGTAYAVDRFQFAGRRLVMGMFLLATLIPGVTTQVAIFQVIYGLNLYNTRWSLVLLYIGTDVIAIYIFLQFMRSIPKSLDEAAVIDGAGPYRIFFRIILPNLKPAIATVAIVKGVGIYNEFYAAFLYVKDDAKRPVSTSLHAFIGVYGAQWELICAGVVITIIPILILFLLLQKWVYAGFASGAVK